MHQTAITRRFFRPLQSWSPLRRLSGVLAAVMTLGVAGNAAAVELALAWDAVDDDRVAIYELHYGTASQTYQTSTTTTVAQARVPSLDPGTTYYFAVRACNASGTDCSAFSNEVSATTAADAPDAKFQIGASSGVAPHQVSFTSTSTGAIDEYLWAFGDGTTSTNAAPTHTYERAGDYSVSLTVTGPGGTSTEHLEGAIQVESAPLIADFTASGSNGIAPLTVTFRDQSTGEIDAYQWDFGDGRSSASSVAVHTYSVPGIYNVALRVEGPGGSATEIKTNLIKVRTQSAVAPVASFNNNVSVGAAPLEVAFHDTSNGSISAYAWDFGDGTQSSTAAPVHRYDEPGAYDVSLTVTGPGGSDTIIRQGLVQVTGDDLVIEYGELAIDHNWQRIDFERSFDDPIVIVSAPSSKGSQPTLTRVDAVDHEGFWARLQEWEYLDGHHVVETVGYLVVERGRHQLENGTWIEANEIELSGSDGYLLTEFEAPFVTNPVVLSTLVTDNDRQAAAIRQRRIEPSGFELRLQHKEASKIDHGLERVAYLAWEPSIGEINGQPFEVSATLDAVTDTPYRIDFATPFEQAPVFLAQDQSADGGDTANLRWRTKRAGYVKVYIDEEQSKDSETRHTTETAGYISLSPMHSN